MYVRYSRDVCVVLAANVDMTIQFTSVTSFTIQSFYTLTHRMIVHTICTIGGARDALEIDSMTIGQDDANSTWPKFRHVLPIPESHNPYKLGTNTRSLLVWCRIIDRYKSQIGRRNKFEFVWGTSLTRCHLT